MGGDRWTKVKNLQAALSNWSNEGQDEGQARGWEQRRTSPAPDDNNPPQYDPLQRFPSDPGPHNFNGPWHNPPPPPPQDFPSSPYNQNYQGGQYQAGFSPQYHAAPATTGSHQYTNSHAYGPNQGYFRPQHPAPYPPYNPAYQQQPMTSTGQGHQGGQSADPYTHPQNTGQPASSSHSPPLDPRPGSQNPQHPNQSPNFPGQSYHPRSSGGSLSRTVTAPANLHCEHGYPRN